MNKKIILEIIAVVAVIAGFGWLVAHKGNAAQENGATVSGDQIISRSGIHWHPHLAISIKGVAQEIPEEVGLGPVESPLHTHAADGIIHLEYGGTVHESDTKLGRFFGIWGKKFDRDCIFDQCNGSDGTVKFFVNGAPNSDFENYKMKDKDQIEIRFE
ncbi:MAG: hypothetical protein HW383_103 [Candidatus Magasanikbacteria bacterium]|nr:hypothetical protein [Candidatus Magasanikbacteria bacterium]